MMEKLDKEAIRLNNILSSGESIVSFCKEWGGDDTEGLDILISRLSDTCEEIDFLQYIRNEYERDNSYNILLAHLEGPDLMERVPQDWVTIIPRNWFFMR